MCVILLIMIPLFVFTAVMEGAQVATQRYREKHPRLNYRKQWN